VPHFRGLLLDVLEIAAAMENHHWISENNISIPSYKDCQTFFFINVHLLVNISVSLGHQTHKALSGFIKKALSSAVNTQRRPPSILRKLLSRTY
jgi:hypothetical protein